MSDLERDQLHAVVKRQFGLDNATTDELLAEGTQAEREAVDLYHFTSLINRSIDDEGRRRIVEMMWEIIYADGRANEFESNLMWRAADIACPYDGRLTSHTVSYANAPPARHGHVLKCHDMFRRTDWPDRRGRN